MKIIVVGCGRMGAELAYRLFSRGHDVAVIDYDEATLNYLAEDFHGRMFEGDPMDQDVLLRAGIKTCDALAAITESDSVNLVVGHIARTYFNVPHVVARNFDPIYRTQFEAFNLQVVSATGWAAQRLEELMYHEEIRTVFSAGNGEVEVYEIRIPEVWQGSAIQDLVNGDCLPVSLSRGGKAVLPSAEMKLMEDDVLLVSATLDGIETARARLLSRKDN